MSFSVPLANVDEVNDGNRGPGTPHRRSAFRPSSIDYQLEQININDARVPLASANSRSGVIDSLSITHRATAGLLETYYTVSPIHCRYESPFPTRCLTKPAEGVYNDDFDNEDRHLIISVDEIIIDTVHNRQYLIADILGVGTFKQVVKCVDSSEKRLVALKIIKNDSRYMHQGFVEQTVLTYLHRYYPHEGCKYFVNILSGFMFRNHLCLVLEHLRDTVYGLVPENSNGVPLPLLQTYIHHLLSALVLCHKVGVMHGDVKSDNIMRVGDDTDGLKLIDFGSAMFQPPRVDCGYIQSRYYRAPEILLGMRDFDCKIDIWSLGCVIAEMYLALPLFPGRNTLNMIERISDILEPFPTQFLQRCRRANEFYNYVQDRYTHKYTLKSRTQYMNDTGRVLPPRKMYFKEKTLKDIIMKNPCRLHDDIPVRESFVDLLRGLLAIDPKERWSAEEALTHPFLKNQPLPEGRQWVPPSRLPAISAHQWEATDRRVHRAAQHITRQSSSRHFAGWSSFDGSTNHFPLDEVISPSSNAYPSSSTQRPLNGGRPETSKLEDCPDKSWVPQARDPSDNNVPTDQGWTTTGRSDPGQFKLPGEGSVGSSAPALVGSPALNIPNGLEQGNTLNKRMSPHMPKTAVAQKGQSVQRRALSRQPASTGREQVSLQPSSALPPRSPKAPPPPPTPAEFEAFLSNPRNFALPPPFPSIAAPSETGKTSRESTRHRSGNPKNPGQRK